MLYMVRLITSQSTVEGSNTEGKRFAVIPMTRIDRGFYRIAHTPNKVRTDRSNFKSVLAKTSVFFSENSNPVGLIKVFSGFYRVLEGFIRFFQVFSIFPVFFSFYGFADFPSLLFIVVVL